MEIAGVVLGIVPILVATIDQYAKLYRMLKRYKKYRDGVVDLLDCLQTQGTIFQNETRLLLIPIFGRENAKAMIRDTEHPSWSDSTTRLEEALGDSRDSFRSAASRVNSGMNALHRDLIAVGAVDGSGEVGEGKTNRRRKFKYTFSEPKLRDLVVCIREATNDFRTLRSQIQEISLSKDSAVQRVQNEKSSSQSDRIRMTRTAAKRIYEALSKACTVHIQHQAHFSLNPVYSSPETRQRIRFKIAFYQTSNSQGLHHKDTFWFVVETLMKDNIMIPMTNSVQALTASKRPPSPLHDSLQQAGQSRHAKRVRFQSPDRVFNNDVGVEPQCMVAPSIPSPIKLSVNKNLCTHLRANCSSINHSGDLCIGLLEDSEEWRLPVYCSKTSDSADVESRDETLKSLSSLFGISQQEGCLTNNGMPIIQRLRCAKLLAQAVLNLQATKWMQSPWSSRDIMVYNRAISQQHYYRHHREHIKSQSEHEPELFIDVPIRRQNSLDGTNNNDEDDQEEATDPPFIHNTILFYLGVVLLELAHSRPLHDMRRDERDQIPGLPPVMADHFTAFRQAKRINGFMGPKYAEIVRKCLHCDFGQGWNLADPSLQDAVQTEVVSELDRLETGLRALTVT